MKSFQAAGIVFVLLMAGCSRKMNETGPSSGIEPVPSPAAMSPLPVRKLSPEMERLRKSASDDAARLRDLNFINSVGMTELTGWEYGTRTSEMARVLVGEELNSLGRLAAAGGILPEGTNLGSLASSFAAMSSSANYSPLDKQVLLVSDFNNKPLLVHEFTHALQDQHFDLMRLLKQRRLDFDQSEALFAVIEGDAMNVERRFENGPAFDHMSLDAIGKAEDARFDDYRKEVGSLFQPLLTETFVFRYRDGARFVEAVRRQSGERGIDELFTNPPVSTTQILHPEKYFAGVRPQLVEIDNSNFLQAGWKEASATSLGEIGVRGVLMAGTDARTAGNAAAGWAGDRAVLFERVGATPLFVWKTTWDKESDAIEFCDAFKLLKEHQGVAESVIVADSASREIKWDLNGRTTIMKLSGNTVIVVRGAERDAQWAIAQL